MIFTDDDLKRFRRFVDGEDMRIHLLNLPALLVRLEAAEKVCKAARNRLEEWTSATYLDVKDSYEAWCKAAGK